MRRRDFVRRDLQREWRRFGAVRRRDERRRRARVLPSRFVAVGARVEVGTRRDERRRRARVLRLRTVVVGVCVVGVVGVCFVGGVVGGSRRRFERRSAIDGERVWRPRRRSVGERRRRRRRRRCAALLRARGVYGGRRRRRADRGPHAEARGRGGRLSRRNFRNRVGIFGLRGGRHSLLCLVGVLVRGAQTVVLELVQLEEIVRYRELPARFGQGFVEYSFWEREREREKNAVFSTNPVQQETAPACRGRWRAWSCRKEGKGLRPQREGRDSRFVLEDSDLGYVSSV